MTASLPNPIYLHSGVTLAERTQSEKTPRVRVAARRLAEIVNGGADETLRACVANVEHAALEAERRIVELENEVERMRRREWALAAISCNAAE